MNTYTRALFAPAGDGEKFLRGRVNTPTLVAYDLLGRKVASLVHENRKAGTYRVSFDGSHLSSGVYFVRLSFPGKTLNHKILLQK
jgi:hypothetical protein